MEDIIRFDTFKTPFINFDYQKGLIEIKGKSIPEDSVNFYKPLWDWIESLNTNPPAKINANLEIDYINSSSLKCLIGIMKRLKELKNKNIEININWYCEAEDEDMLDIGKECEESAGITFNIIEVSKN